MYEDCMILSLRFPQKLWRIVNECKDGAIQWSLSGNTILLDYKKFQKQYLDAGNSIFKTKNITSFIRQLNLYGFRKVTSHNRDPICNLHNPDVHEFLHDHFRIGRADLLSKVCRKTAGKIKYPEHTDTKNIIEHDFAEQRTNRMSRLRMCRLALTKALEQITQEYHQTQCNSENVNYSFVNPVNSRETVTDLFDIDFYAVPSHDSNARWIAKRSVPLSSRNHNKFEKICCLWYF